MWNFLTRTFSGAQYRNRYPVRSDSLVYAVGDVHGRIDLLEPLIEKILNDALRSQPEGSAQAEVVFLGDVIDRGPDTVGVLELLIAIESWPELKPIFLIGNHEQMLLAFLKDPLANKRWLRFGGYETLVSYNVDVSGDLFDPQTLVRLAADLSAVMGPHVDLLNRFVLSHKNGNLFFVHAGADPTKSVDEQSETTMIWGAKTEDTRTRRDGMWVVHGHTVVEQPLVRGGRISIDTGAYLSGALTALKVHGEEISFLRETGSAADGSHEDWHED